MKPFPHKRFKALLVIQLSMVLLFFLLMLFGAFMSRNSLTDFDLLMFGVVFLFIGVHVANLLYNFKLLRVYNDEPDTATFSKSLSMVLLTLYIIGFAASFFTIASSVYEALTIDGHYGLLNKPFYLMLLFIFIMAVLSIWIIILQIKLLRLLKRLQTAKADELVEIIGD
jgi:magnesium-transporting ATPase (P-type)